MTAPEVCRPSNCGLSSNAKRPPKTETITTPQAIALGGASDMKNDDAATMANASTTRANPQSARFIAA